MTTSNPTTAAPEPDSIIHDASTFISNFEDAATIPPIADLDRKTALSATLQRAESVVQLLIADGDDGEFSLKHELVMNALWSLQGYIEQARALVNAPGQIPAPTPLDIDLPDQTMVGVLA